MKKVKMEKLAIEKNGNEMIVYEKKECL